MKMLYGKLSDMSPALVETSIEAKSQLMVHSDGQSGDYCIDEQTRGAEVFVSQESFEAKRGEIIKKWSHEYGHVIFRNSKHHLASKKHLRIKPIALYLRKHQLHPCTLPATGICRQEWMLAEPWAKPTASSKPTMHLTGTPHPCHVTIGAPTPLLQHELSRCCIRVRHRSFCLPPPRYI